MSTQDAKYAITDAFELTGDKAVGNLTFNLSTSALEVRAVDVETGKDVPGTRVVPLNELGCGFYSKTYKTPEYDSSDAGKHLVSTIDFIPAGKYMVRAYVKGYFFAKSDYVELLDNKTKQLARPAGDGPPGRNLLIRSAPPAQTRGILR